MSQVDDQRQAIRDRLLNVIKSRHLVNRIMAEMDRLCLMVTASCLGLKDQDVVLPKVKDDG